MIVKVLKIKFEKFLGIGYNLGFNIKKYLDRNTGSNYMNGEIKHIIYEFRFIDGRRCVYKEIYSKSSVENKVDEIMNIIKPVERFSDLIIMSIEKE